MVSLSNNDIEIKKSRLKREKRYLGSVFIVGVCFYFSSLLEVFAPNPTSILTDHAVSLFSMSFSFLTVIFSFGILSIQTSVRLKDELRNDKIKKIEDNAKHIEDSISLFYVPLQNLLTVYSKNGETEVKMKMINEINGYKYLAEPRVRAIFEEYLESENESFGESKKLLELVCRDIELLQKKLIKLKMEQVEGVP